MLQSGVPFNERGGKLRGCLDLISGRFPRFVFGGAVGRDILPVFHFHDETHDELEPKLRYLSENGYRGVSCDEIAAFVSGSSRPAKRVGLCFDDAWKSVWTVAAPLLKHYGLTAIVYAIPARIAGSDQVSDTGSDRKSDTFVSWAQLREMHDSGLFDVQCHTFSHSRVFCSSELAGFVTPDYSRTPLLNRPQVTPPPALRFVAPTDLGAPLYPARSRMSDGRRIAFGPEARDACVSYVAGEGGAAFFERSDWRPRLEAVVRKAGSSGRPESEDAQRAAVEEELDRGRAVLNERLAASTVRHVCLPWGVSGETTAAALKRLGFRTAFANRLRGLHAVRAGDDPLWLKRLPNKYIFHLPGHGRRTWL